MKAREIPADCASKLAGYADDDLVPDTVTRQIFGGRTRMTLWRWQRDDGLGFPFPQKIKKRNYRKAGELKRFLARMEAAGKL